MIHGLSSDKSWAEVWRLLTLVALVSGLALVLSGDDTGAIGCWVLAVFGELRAQSRLWGTR